MSNIKILTKNKSKNVIFSICKKPWTTPLGVDWGVLIVYLLARDRT